MSVWFGGAVLERAWYAGEKVGAAVEKRFCALGNKERDFSGGVLEYGREDSCLWARIAWLYSLGCHLVHLGCGAQREEVGSTDAQKLLNIPETPAQNSQLPRDATSEAQSWSASC